MTGARPEKESVFGRAAFSLTVDNHASALLGFSTSYISP